MPLGLIVPDIYIPLVSFRSFCRPVITNTVNRHEGKVIDTMIRRVKCFKTVVKESGKCLISNLWLFIRTLHLCCVCLTYCFWHFFLYDIDLFTTSLILYDSSSKTFFLQIRRNRCCSSKNQYIELYLIKFILYIAVDPVLSYS